MARLEAQVARVLDMVAARDAESAKLRARIAKRRNVRAEDVALRARVAETRVAEFDAQLGHPSTNSHKPRSSDAPSTRPPKPPTGRKRGAQPGHAPHKRPFVPSEQVTRTTTAHSDRGVHA